MGGAPEGAGENVRQRSWFFLPDGPAGFSRGGEEQPCEKRVPVLSNAAVRELSLPCIERPCSPPPPLLSSPLLCSPVPCSALLAISLPCPPPCYTALLFPLIPPVSNDQRVYEISINTQSFPCAGRREEGVSVYSRATSSQLPFPSSIFCSAIASNRRRTRADRRGGGLRTRSRRRSPSWLPRSPTLLLVPLPSSLSRFCDLLLHAWGGRNRSSDPSSQGRCFSSSLRADTVRQRPCCSSPSCRRDAACSRSPAAAQQLSPAPWACMTPGKFAGTLGCS